jgi:F0F1-type ATP synthase assembly protein I
MKFRVAVSIAVAENMTVVLNEISMVVVFCWIHKINCPFSW